MAMKKIRKDSYSLYLFDGTAIFRPVKSTYCKDGPLLNDGTETEEGMKVKATHMSGTALMNVKYDKMDEYWFCHGHVKLENGKYSWQFVSKNSKKCWCPVTD